MIFLESILGSKKNQRCIQDSVVTSDVISRLLCNSTFFQATAMYLFISHITYSHILFLSQQVEDIATVTTKDGRELQVRNGVWANTTVVLSFALWRSHATFPMAIGQCLRITAAVVGQTTDGEPKLTSGRLTHIEVFIMMHTIT